MGLGGRIGSVFLNLLLLIPLIGILIASAITSSIAAANMHAIQDQSSGVKNAYKMVTTSTIILWVLFAIALVVGPWMIPMIASIPYLYAFVMIIFMAINLAIAGMFFYAVNEVRKTKDYKDDNKHAKTAYNTLLGIGVTMVVSSVMLLFYIWWGVHEYRKKGGLAGDVALAAQVAPVVAPEFAPVAAVAGGYAQQQLNPMQQQEAQNRAQGFQTLVGTQEAPGVLQQLNSSNIMKTVRENPQLLQQAINAFG